MGKGETAKSKKRKHCVGLIVVHGIGEQERNKTRDNVIRGLNLVYPEARITYEDDVGVIENLDRDVRIYEAHWAHILSGNPVQDSFKIDILHEIVWYPLLNRRYIHKYKKIYSRWITWGWTIILLPLCAILTAAYHGLDALAGVFDNILSGIRLRNQKSPSNPTPTFREAIKNRRKSGMERSNLFTRFMGEWVGDIFNYVNAAGAVPAPVPEAADRIYNELKSTLKRAVSECSEIQIIAHSLGSLITYHALTRYQEQTFQYVSVDRTMKEKKNVLTRLYTIGSPLEKIRFFWPKLITPPTKAFSQSKNIEWYNFTSRLDLVSGLLRHYEGLPKVQNHKIFGSGGLITAHSGYNSNIRFLKIFGPELTGTSVTTNIGLFKRVKTFVQSLLESMIVPCLLVALAAIGTIFLIFSGWIFGVTFKWLLSFMEDLTSWGGFGTAGTWFKVFLSWMVPFILIFLAVPLGKSKAKKTHKEYWTKKPKMAEHSEQAHIL